MNKKLLLSMLFFFIFISVSCSKRVDYLTFPDNFDTEIRKASLALPYEEAFESGMFNNVQDFTPCYKWQIVDEDGDNALKCVWYNEDEVITGEPVFSLMIGDLSWEDYTFSFDFKLEEGSWITFAPYADTNGDSNTPDYFESRNPWSLRLNWAGELYYDTVFTHGAHAIVQAPECVEGYNKNEWNHIELTPVGLSLTMKINDADIGAVAELQGNESGRISIGGGVGCMFDKIKVAELR